MLSLSKHLYRTSILKLFRKSEPKRAAGFFAGCPLVSRMLSCLRRADSRQKSRQPAAYAAEFDFLNSSNMLVR